MFTKPGDLPEDVLAGTLRDHWGFVAGSLEYQAVGFGSHHWLATDTAGRRLFATVDDLAAKLRTAGDTPGAACTRLRAAYATALVLRNEAGLAFVLAPVPAGGGQVLARLSDRYTLVVHPFLAGSAAGEYGRFASGSDRRAVLDMLVQVHRTRAGNPGTDDFVVPNLDALQAMTGKTDRAWRAGPYARPAQDLLQAHSRGLNALVNAYHDLASQVAARPERMVITHGEPHAGNVIATTGTQIDDEALTLYRLWWDLSEIGGYLRLFHAEHGDTADARESWKDLRHYLRPAERWPQLAGHTA